MHASNPKSAATRLGSGLFTINFSTKVKEEKLTDLEHCRYPSIPFAELSIVVDPRSYEPLLSMRENCQFWPRIPGTCHRAHFCSRLLPGSLTKTKSRR